MTHRDFEIENSLDQNVRVGANYSYSFQPLNFEPFKKKDSLFNSDFEDLAYFEPAYLKNFILDSINR